MKTTADLKTERLSAGQKVGVINLGCARNLVDAQLMLGRLKRNGHRIVDAGQAQTVIVNTCAFIEAARRESVDTILDLLELKKKGRISKVIVAGCLAQRYGRDLAEEFQGVDAFVGTPALSREGNPVSLQLTAPHFAYVKICESCFNACSFCAIPKIKGKFVSRTMESILSEVKSLDARGVREINLIGQDITAWGMDIYREKALAKLLKALAGVCRGIAWIRLLYAFPAHMTDELIGVMACEPKVCKYIDMPLQHISDHLLKEQNRNITTSQTYALVRRIREAMPQAFLRTTYIVGLPGESAADFQQLRAFNREMRFERAGVFLYSKEEGTPAALMPHQVPARVKKERLDILMRDLQDISRKVQERFVGRRLNVLIESKEKGEGNIFLGRSEYDAPEVDGLVFVRSAAPLSPGQMVPVDITDAYEYDLAGVAA